MIKYSNPIIISFPNKHRRLANRIYNVTHDMRDLSVSLCNKHNTLETAQCLNDKLDILRLLLREACEKNFYEIKEVPPLSLHQWDVWSRYNDEIGRLIGGALNSIESSY